MPTNIGEEVKEELQSMGYIALKSYEGQNCELYGDWKSKRQEIRDEINSPAAMSNEEWDAQFDVPENDEDNYSHV